MAGCESGATGPEADCPAVLALAPGEVVEASAPASFCVSNGGRAEYAVVSFMDAAPDQKSRLRVFLAGEGYESVGDIAGGTASGSPDLGERNVFFEGTARAHARLREREREELRPFMAAAREQASRPRPGYSATSVAVGDEVVVDVSPSCGTPDPRSGRVVAVTEHAVVVDDPSNPPPRFSEQELTAFGRTFDTLVEPLVTGAFGEPSDLDGNGRVVLFFTRGVNDQGLAELGVVSGFFWSGDLLPAGQCPSSNGGEVLYLAVPDGEGGPGRPQVDPQLIREVLVATMGHELQHLINASRRIFETGAGPEETWLNEALSHVVEELLFYAVSGFDPGMNVGQEVLQDPSLKTPFREFALNNVGRYNLFLQSPRSYSPIGADGLAPRGAGWGYLRYVLDRYAGDDGAVLRALGGGPSTGLDNLQAATGINPLEWMGDWSVAVLLDDLDSDIHPIYRQPSWNFRELIPPMRPDGAFPLRLMEWPENSTFAFDLQPGSAAHVRFAVEAGGHAEIEVTAPEQEEGQTVRVWIVRTR